MNKEYDLVFVDLRTYKIEKLRVTGVSKEAVLRHFMVVGLAWDPVVLLNKSLSELTDMMKKDDCLVELYETNSWRNNVQTSK